MVPQRAGVQRRRLTETTLFSNPPPHTSPYYSFVQKMFNDSSSLFVPRTLTFILIFAAASVSCFFLLRDADSLRFLPHLSFTFSSVSSISPACDLDDSSPVIQEHSLQRVLEDAAMPDRTVILTTLNEAWAAPNSVLDLFLESFRIGNLTRRLLNHLVIIALDKEAYQRCLTVHTHCFALTTEGVDFHQQATFMSPDYLTMMWRRIDFLRSVLELGYNFVFTDADIMWFRNPFPRFYPDADFQIACDHFFGKSDNLENSPNGGYNYVKSNNRSIEFYKYWYAARETHPGLHDQDVLNQIKYDTFIHDLGLKIRFLDTTFFGGLCEPRRNLNLVCTMHANCCIGLENKLCDLRLMIQDWKHYMSMLPNLKKRSTLSWSVPRNCSI